MNRMSKLDSFEEKHDALMTEALESNGLYAQRSETTFIIDIHKIRVTSDTEKEAQKLWFRAAGTNAMQRMASQVEGMQAAEAPQ
jgi:hypothetical protein